MGIKGSRRIPLLVVVSLLFPLLQGCWDRLEIEQRAVVLGIGIDEADEKTSPEPNEISYLPKPIPAPNISPIRLTVQIAIPGKIPLGPGSSGGGGGGGGGGGKTVWVVQADGKTINSALNNLQQRVASPLFYGHLRVIIVSKAVAKRGIQNLNDFLHRNPEIRRMNWMLISQGKAEQIMNVSPQLERVPTFYLMDTMDQSIKMGRFPNDFIGMFWSSTSAKGREGYLPYIMLKQQGTVQISGLAFFKNDKMVGVTKPLEIPLYMGIIGANPAGGEVFVQVPGTSENILIGARNRKSSIKTEIRNGKPLITVDISIEGNLLEKSSGQTILSEQTIIRIEQQLKKNIIKAYQNLIKKTQDKGSDIFGFGEYVRAKQPGYWNREIKTKQKWQTMYKELPVEVNVKIHIRRIGMKAT